MIRKKFIVNGLATVVLAFVGLISTNVSSVSASTDVRIQGTATYDDQKDVPQYATIDGVKCKLVEKKGYNYKSPNPLPFQQQDYCIWNKYDVTMHFHRGPGWEWMKVPNWNVKEIKVGSRTYKIACNVHTHQVAVHFSQYLPPNGTIPLPNNVHGQSSINYRDCYNAGVASGKSYGEFWFDTETFNGGEEMTRVYPLPNSSWVGPSNVVTGGEYYTGYHDYYRWFTKTFYYGIYKPLESHPYLYTTGVADHKYQDKSTNVFWYQLKDGSGSTRIHIGFKDNNSDLAHIYPFYYYGDELVLRSYAKGDAFNSPKIEASNSEYYSSQSSSKRDVGSKHADVWFTTKFKKPGIYTVSASAYSKNHYWQDPSRDKNKPVDTKIKLGLDEVGPDWEELKITENKNTYIKVETSGFSDFADKLKTITGSGLNKIQVATFPENSSYKGAEIWTTLTLNGDSASGTCKFYNKFLDSYGTWRADVYYYDNVGNKHGIILRFTRADPHPESVTTDVTGWSYAEPNTNYKWYSLDDKIYIESVAWSNKGMSEVEKGFPSSVNTWIDQYKYRVLSNQVKKSTPSWKSNYYSNLSMETNFSSSNFTLVSKFRSRGEASSKKYTKTNVVMKGTKSADGLMAYTRANAFTQYDGDIYYYKNDKNAYVNEKDGDVICIDGSAPSVKSVTNYNTANIHVEDNMSGIKQIQITDVDKRVIKTINLNPNDPKRTTYDLTDVSVDPDDGGYARVEDNVGNSKYYYIEPAQGTPGVGINVDNTNLTQSIMNDRIFKGMIHGNRRMMKVQAIAKNHNVYVWYTYTKYTDSDGIEHTESHRHEYTPVIQFVGSGLHVSGPIIYQVQSTKMSNTIYVDDTTNTTESPTVQYHRDSKDSYIYWNKLEDVIQHYQFGIKAKTRPSGSNSYECNFTDVKFATGYMEDRYSLYPCTPSGAKTGSAIFDKRTGDLKFSMNNIRSGWYRAEVTMYDKNDNPSGTGVLIFYHDQPALFSPFDVSVDAVKDVDWEGIGSINYGETDTDSNKTNYGNREYFPLGQASTAEGTQLKTDGSGNKIAKGYAVHYSFHKENEDELTDFYVTYKFYTPDGKQLKLYQEGKLLSYVDTSQHTTYTKRTFTAQEIADMNDLSKSSYVVHFLPVNFSAKMASTGAEYVGDVLVRMEFHMQIDGTTAKVQKFDLYQVDMTETALDDIEDQKQR